MVLQDYEWKTTFRMDFTIADSIGGVDDIRDTYKRGLEFATSKAEYYAEFVLVLNWKIWEWFEKDEKIARVYQDLWEQADMGIKKYFKGDDKSIAYIYDFLD